MILSPMILSNKTLLKKQDLGGSYYVSFESSWLNLVPASLV